MYVMCYVCTMYVCCCMYVMCLCICVCVLLLLCCIGPLDAGFSLGQACDNGVGSCSAGTDVNMCEMYQEKTCGTSHVIEAMFMSDCGGHAIPYHLHTLMSCEYNQTQASTHSPLVGVIIDGYGLYGKWEGSGLLPTDLDACGGHYGPVPATTINGVTYPAASNVYHYHVQPQPPYFVGCFGPVANLATAETLYSGCSAAPMADTCTSIGKTANYTVWCPVFSDQYGSKIIK